eukprot:4507921-Amphidinium_carterae.1
MAPGIAKALAGYYLSSTRNLFMNGAFDPTPFRLSCALVQGCAISAFLCNILGELWIRATTPYGQPSSFQDDRMAICASRAALAQLWEASTAWDLQNGWEAHPAKTKKFTTARNTTHLTAGEMTIQAVDRLQHLGCELITKYNIKQVIIHDRVDVAIATCRRLQHLHIPFDAKLWLVQTVVIPQGVYGLYSQMPNGRALSKLQTAIRALLWPTRKFASWQAACVGVYPAHRTDPWSAAAYSHIITFIAAMRTNTPIQTWWLELQQFLPVQSARGPASVFLLFLDKLGIEFSDT